jgi:glycosyltransferase involved in cell wall biosynthesis
MPETESSLELSIVMPCLNEAETVAVCVKKALQFLREKRVVGEVIVADNGSTDGSQKLAEDSGARVVCVPERGYGSALRAGMAAAHGRFLIMGDADDSYDFLELSGFLERLRAGDDLVLGNRFKGGIKPNAMPPLHRFLGNPVLTGIGRLFFKSPVGDFHCGLRGLSKTAFEKLGLQTTGMEFASEMVVKATLLGMRLTEVPTTLSPDGRSRPPHLRSWRDGWRHLRFLLLYSPRWLFLYPGLALIIVGLLLGVWLMPGPRKLGGVTLDVHTLLYAALAVIMGVQTVLFALFTKVFAITFGLLPSDPGMERWNRAFTLEAGLVTGGGMFLAGFASAVWAVMTWSHASFGPLDPTRTLRLVIPSIMMIVTGLQIVFGSFFLSVLRLGHPAPPPAGSVDHS